MEKDPEFRHPVARHRFSLGTLFLVITLICAWIGVGQWFALIRPEAPPWLYVVTALEFVAPWWLCVKSFRDGERESAIYLAVVAATNSLVVWLVVMYVSR